MARAIPLYLSHDKSLPTPLPPNEVAACVKQIGDLGQCAAVIAAGSAVPSKADKDHSAFVLFRPPPDENGAAHQTGGANADQGTRFQPRRPTLH